ncbi:MAG: DNA polymerase III subunit delta [Corynebacterium sp.]|uniref:DNA polymerase III subunit delta n=1 Tax=Corynebacterium sp. TaxID=1720 RepID=UPI0026DD0276|nr:DNA polymerase III subunit delta [Corynebacterium sp.]MDO4761395.1 DNA polymerase III subunit delta [Corynebacterium sp.]
MNNVHLIVGDEDFLAERAREEIVAAIRAESENGDAIEISSIRAGDVSEAELLDLCSPSLFGEDRIVIINKMDEAGKEPAELIVRLAKDPGPGISLIIVHSGGGRQKAQVPKLKKLAHVHEVKALRNNERPNWVTQEFRRYGIRPTPDVVHALLEGVGSDLRELASAISQLIADTDGEVTAAKVREYYAGVAEVNGFDVADLACAGQTHRALASMRRALQLGVEPAALAAALSMKVSGIARLYSTRGKPHISLAGKLGMAPFILEKTAQVARRWSGDAVSEAVIIVADLDAAVKGQGGDPAFALEDAVRRISQLAG